MSDREIDVSSAPAPTYSAARFELVTPPNWTAIIFFGCLACMHLSIAVPAFVNKRWEGYMSACLACFFTATALVIFRSKCRIQFDSKRRVIRIRSGFGRFYFERNIDFASVHAVRLTFSPSDRPRSRLEVLCDNEDIECPPTDVPRQEALCLAMLLNVQLIKVWGGSRSIDFDAEPMDVTRI